MKKAILVVIAVLFSFSSTYSKDANLITNGKSDYKIFVSKQATVPEKNAALELQKYLGKISGCQLPIINDADSKAKLIYIGFKGVPKSVLNNLDTAAFGNEEFIIRSDGKSLLIAGGNSRGTIYGVSAYLTDHLGCRWYTREVKKIPFLPTIKLVKTEDRQKPALEYREPHYVEAYNTEWTLHNKTNSRGMVDSLGGSFMVYPSKGHTFYVLVPPEKYFTAHPEYFSEINGVRVGKQAQLCLTNPDVVKIATRQVFEWIRENPTAGAYSVSQNDGEGHCECKNCKALDEAEGSQSGTLIHFVNQVADAVKKVYPNVKLQTFAYTYTEVPPKTLRPADNIIVELCHYAYCSAHPLGTCDNHQPYIDRLEQWQKIAKRVTIWDYYTQFASFLMPYPNFETMKHDVKFYVDRGVMGLFAQGNHVPADGHGEFTELRAWVFAQLMWNPEKDGQELVDEFVKNVYGNASGYVSEYIKLMHDQVKPKSAYFSIWTDPEDTNYLNLKTVQKADSLFALAKEVSKNDPALFKRVERAYLPVIFTKLYFKSIGGTAYVPDNLETVVADYKRIIADNKITTMAEVPEVGSIPAFLARVQSPDKFINKWWLIGPFDNAERKGYAQVYPPEQGFDPTQTYAGVKGAKVKWQAYDDQTSGYIDLAKLFSPKKDVVSYAYRTINLPEAKTMKFGVGSNDGVKVWINGKLVLDRMLLRPAIPNDDQISVPMKKGENTILLKVDQTGNKWGFYFTERE